MVVFCLLSRACEACRAHCCSISYFEHNEGFLLFGPASIASVTAGLPWWWTERMEMGLEGTYDAALIARRGGRVVIVALLIDVEIDGAIGGFKRHDPRLRVQNPRWHRNGGRARFQELEYVYMKGPAVYWLGLWVREPWCCSSHGEPSS